MQSTSHSVSGGSWTRGASSNDVLLGCFSKIFAAFSSTNAGKPCGESEFSPLIRGKSQVLHCRRADLASQACSNTDGVPPESPRNFRDKPTRIRGGQLIG